MKFVLNLASLPYRMVIRNAVMTVGAIKNSRNAEHKVKTLVLNILSVLPLIVAAVVFMVSIISFIAGGFYADQINMIKDGFFDALSNVWTSGNAGNFYSLWSLIPVGAAFLALTAMATIDLFKNRSKGKKAAFIIVTSVMAVAASIAVVLGLSFEAKEFVADFMGISSRSDEIVGIIAIFAGVSVVMAVVDAIMLSKHTEYARCLINSIFCLTVAPLTCLIVENLIGIIAFVIFTVVFFVVGNFTGNAMFSGSASNGGSAFNGGSASNGGSSVGTGVSSSDSKRKANRIAILENEIRKSEKNLDLYNNRRFNIQGEGVDPKYWSSRANKARAELESLKNAS